MYANLKRIHEIPIVRFAFIFLLSTFIVLSALFIALLEPKTEISPKPGMVFTSIQLEEMDFKAEPGDLIEYEKFNQFFERQKTIWKELQSEEVKSRSIRDLSLLFWVQMIVAVGGIIISGWIWALTPNNVATTLFWLSGLSMSFSAAASAVYTTRTLSVDPRFFLLLERINAAGASAFGIFMVGLFLVYPKKLPKWKILFFTEFAIFSLWTLAYFEQLVPESAQMPLIIVSLMLLICLGILFQFLFTKGDPVSRAGLVWIGLSVVVGAGAFVIFNSVPLIFGLPPLDQGYAFLSFLLIYLGLAAGITRFRLFEVGQWAFQFLFYGIGTFLFVALDALLLFMTGMDRFPALGIALIVVGFLYLPLRDFMWRFFARNKEMRPEELLSESLHVAFAASHGEKVERWERLIRKLFHPLNIMAADGPVDQVRIESDGLSMLLPSVAFMPSLRITHPAGGRTLFTPRSIETAKRVIKFIEEAESSREAYDRGVKEERERMAQDLHDDLGARLLSGLHMADDKTRPTFEAAIQDIRGIVSEMSGEEVLLSRLMADARHEAQRRVSGVNIRLDWPLLGEDQHDHLLGYRFQKAIKSALRECISNVIRHSGASELKVSVHSDPRSLRFSIQDNGTGLPSQVVEGGRGGHGLKILRRRVSDLQGEVRIVPYAPGCFIEITLKV